MKSRPASALPLCLLLLLGIPLFTGCSVAEPITVSIEKTPFGYQLLRDGEPYYIKGAGAEDYLDELAEAGANSIRTWGSDQTEQILDRAHALGMTVTAGLWIDHERHYFDYTDPEVYAAALARHCADVDRFKDHPALLMWGVGNEVSIESTNDKVWELIGDIAAYIKKVDPHHPTTTVLPMVTKAEVDAIKRYAPSIDLLGFNCYGGINDIARQARECGWDGPYIIAEWGPNGGWEGDHTSWGIEIEPTTTEKAMQRGLRYSRILEDPHCLGSYAFFWGQKQEVTQTWFGMILEDGALLEAAEVMQYLWTGRMPAETAPRIGPLLLNGRPAKTSVIVPPGTEIEAEFVLITPGTSEVRISWELLPESPHRTHGGDFQERPESLPVEFEPEHPTQAHFQAPAEPGPYRLFVYVHHENGRAASANFPFLVEEAE